MIYIIEGLDRCGKTSFIDVLRNQIKSPYIFTIHSTKPPSNVNYEEWSKKYYTNLISRIVNLSLQGNIIILDRSWIGEAVYGPIYRNTNIPLSYFDSFIKDHVHLFKLFLFIDSPENLISREDGNSLSTQNIDKIKNEVELFKRAFDKSIIFDHNKHLINWENIEFSKEKLIEITQF